MIWGAAVFAVALLLFGDDLLKQAALKKEYFSWMVLGGALAYAASAPLWAYILQTKSLTQIGVMYSVLTIIGLSLLGWLRYGETPTPWQAVAVVLAIAAVVTSEM